MFSSSVARVVAGFCVALVVSALIAAVVDNTFGFLEGWYWTLAFMGGGRIFLGAVAVSTVAGVIVAVELLQGRGGRPATMAGVLRLFALALALIAWLAAAVTALFEYIGTDRPPLVMQIGFFFLLSHVGMFVAWRRINRPSRRSRR